MNIENFITERFKNLMSCHWNDYPTEKNLFEKWVCKLRQVLESGEPFAVFSQPYHSHLVAEYGYKIQEYCGEDVSKGTIERLVIDELNKRGLVHATIVENADPSVIPAGTIRISGTLTPVVLENELLPSDEFLGHPIYKHKGKSFTIESVQQEDAPVNNVGGGNIAGVSPGQEPPGKRGLYFARNLKKTKKLNKKLKHNL